jgi:agmatine deiminase
MEAAASYRMPAEWEPHAATWIAWPHNRGDWPGKFGPIPWVYVEIVRHLHQSERVRILVNDADAERDATRKLRRAGVDLKQLDFLHFQTNRVWTRDYGPMFVRGATGEIAIIDWHFNAWAKYPDWQDDDQIPQMASRQLGVSLIRPVVAGKRIVMEGGAIDVNGHGLLLTTEECLLSDVQARNPGVSRVALEGLMRQYLGIAKVLWLGQGIAGDDTHGHVDDLARFVGPSTVVIAAESNQSDANFEPLRENRRRLVDMTNQAGQRLDVVPLPMPKPLHFNRQRLPASYANFYIANDCVLVPTFNDPNDQKALGILADCFPNRRVVGIHSVNLVWGLGTLHCLTQQEPA